MNLFKKFLCLFSKKDECSCDNKQNNQEQKTLNATLLQLNEHDLDTIKNLDENIVIGKIIEVTAHPDSKITKVKVTKTDLGNGQIETILCGGTNVQENIIVAVAKVGSKLSADFEIGVRAIRGVESHGMICARSELNLSPANEQNGEIWILPNEIEKYLGTSIKNI